MKQRPPGEHHHQVGFSAIGVNFLPVKAKRSGESVLYRAQKGPLSQAHTAILHPLAQNSYDVELGWKMILAFTGSKSPGPWHWLPWDRNDKEPLSRKLLSTQGFLSAGSSYYNYAPERLGSSLQLSLMQAASWIPVSPSPWTHRIPMPQKHSTFWSLGRNELRVWRSPCPIGGRPSFPSCPLTSHGTRYPGNSLWENIVSVSSFVLGASLSILLLIMTLKASFFGDVIKLERIPQM